MSVLVTGGAGFIGSHIVNELVNEGYKVVVVDDLSNGKKEHINKKAKFYDINIKDNELELVFKKEKIRYIIHTAAQIDVQKSVKQTKDDGEVNILGTVNLLKNAVKYKVKKFIYSSSQSVYGEPEYLPIDEKHPIEPISFYGVSKYSPELYIKTYNRLFDLNYTILRYSNVYGPNQNVTGEGGIIEVFINSFKYSEPLRIYGNGKQKRDFIYVKDVAKANILAMNNDKNDILNIGSGEKTSINEVVNILKKISGDIEISYKKPWKSDIKDIYLDIEKAKRDLKFEPEYDLESGLKETYKHKKRS